MVRPPQANIRSEIACPQCGASLPTTYTCQHEGFVNVELVELKCKCGYTYAAHSRHGTKP